MSRVRAQLVSLFAAAVIAVTSLAAATAEGTVVVGEQAVICSGGALVTVTLGPDGQPVRHVQICPDYGMQVLTGVLPMPDLPLRPQTFHRLPTIVAKAIAASRPSPAPLARGPPFDV